MTVRAVQQNESSPVGTIVKATAVGTAAGYASKYLLPITKQEDFIGKKTMINTCRKVINKSKAAEFLKNQKNGLMSPAQDVFVKLVETKDKKAFTFDGIASRVKALGGEESAAGKEFRGIIRNVNENSKAMSRRLSTAYHIMLKNIRPTVPFLVAGAGIGFLAGFVHNVMKTDA